MNHGHPATVTSSLQTCYSKKHVIKSITVFRGKAGDAEDDSKQVSRRVTAVTMKYSDDSEQSVGEASNDDTVNQETYQLEEGELVTEVHYHYPVHVMEKRGKILCYCQNQSQRQSSVD